ncbi:17.1 kDa class II heat shock protein-like [Lycium ferocissimum]|uniref:17.1 kDa class II heat shock protein-like n=1 Tax=Lycium ferocissimum TaxID=112874 RepID=UPI0028161B39|nr:17.1 kDa class II heat shock protein-like [Lycium ferocissimum]
MDIALRDLGFDPSMIGALHDMFDIIDDTTEQKPQHPSRAYIRDTKAMRATPADVMEYPNAYQFLVDMPGLKPDQVKVQLEDENVLVVSGERKREKEKEEKEGIKYLRMERRFGKLLKKFVLPENANTEAISAAFQDGVLVVTVEKRPPPEPKKPKVIEVKLGESTTGTSGVQATDEGGAGERVQDGTGGIKTD